VKAKKVLLFILLTIALLGIISWIFPKEGIHVFGKQLYFPSLEDVLTPEKKQESVLEHLAEMERQMQMQQRTDSIAQAYNDSLSFYTNFFESHPGRIHVPEGDYSFFSDLFESLEQCEEKQEVVHILHYGDSQIEADRITGYIRQELQDRFGGKGAGLIPAVQTIPTSSVGQTASENIVRYIISGMEANRVGHRRYGVLGQVGQTYGGGSIYAAARNWKDTHEHAKEFSKVRLYVGKADNFTASLSAGEMTTSGEEGGTSAVKVLSWAFDEPIKKINLRMSGSAEIYGIALDGQFGVAVDNIPFRGSSGTFFSGIDSASMADMMQDLNVGLVILQFGGNMMPVVRSDKVIADYKEKMANQIRYIQQIYPHAKVLMIGPSDMSTKVNGKLQTYPRLPDFVEGIKQAALENGAAFWNIYEAMGGFNSMINWVKEKPSLAATDYIHFNMRGANRIAELFCHALLIYYDYFCFERNRSLVNRDQ